MALEYGNVAKLVVPTADTTDNADMRDVVGNKTDAAQTTVAANKSLTAYVKGIITNIAAIPQSRLYLTGTCDVGMAGSATTVVCAELAGYGNDYFNKKYHMIVLLNINSVGNAPERTIRQVSDYVSATGTFTVTAFGANVEAGDKIAVLHESIAGLDPSVPLASDVAITSGIVGYVKALIQELDQRKVAKVAWAMGTLANYTDVVNITDKGVLTGISQTIMTVNGALKTSNLKIIIDGITVLDTSAGQYLTTNNVTAYDHADIGLSFNHIFNTSLQVQHKSSGAADQVQTAVSYTIDD